MSIEIIKPGIGDTFRDAGRYGYQHLGVNPGGAMDIVAMQVANVLVGNNAVEAVLEMHFPAPEMLFKHNAFIGISGADFMPSINGSTLPVHTPVFIKKGSLLKFLKPLRGARLYMSVNGGFKINCWLNSYSTNLQCKRGGFQGRVISKGDVLEFKQPQFMPFSLGDKQYAILPFSARVQELYAKNGINILPGKQYNLLTQQSKQQLLNEPFIITSQSNCMGYRLQSFPLEFKREVHIISTAVTNGTIQLLPSGQLIILMADHQTTGGYPVIGHVISAHMCSLAQYTPGSSINFKLCNNNRAEELICSQHLHLKQLKNACNFRLNEYR